MTTQPLYEEMHEKPAAIGEYVKFLPRFFIALAFVAVLLLVPAGTLNWRMAWVLIGMYFVYFLVLTSLLLRLNPGLIAERSRMMTPDTKPWDKVITIVMTPIYLGTWVLAGLDFRYGWSPEVGLVVQIIALALVIVGHSFLGWAMVVNRYFSRVVRIQDDRGHEVTTGGPYRIMRHPGYAGFIVAWPAAALALGSLWALIPAAVTAVALIVRTALEDRTLQKELPGYAEYTQETRYRLLPGIW